MLDGKETGNLPEPKFCHELYNFVMNFIRSQWMVYNKNKRLNRYRMTDFAAWQKTGYFKRDYREKKEAVCWFRSKRIFTQLALSL